MGIDKVSYIGRRLTNFLISYFAFQMDLHCLMNSGALLYQQNILSKSFSF